MFKRTFLSAALLAAAFAAPSFAQEGPTRVAVCNPSKVFAEMDERKAIEQKLNSEREKIKGQIAARKQEIEQLKQERDQMRPGSAPFNEKNKELMSKAVEFQVWAQLTEAELNRTEKEQIKTLFDKIIEGAKTVAEARKIDLVMAERRPDLKTMDNLTPEQVRGLLSQWDVLYTNEKVDITVAVTAEVNKKYAVGAGGAAAADKK